jgi:hypothetical protein
MNTILHYDGSAWSKMVSNNTLPLHAVWGSSDSNVFAVGGGWDAASGDLVGVILHYDGDAWSEMDSRIDWPLYGAWGTGDDNIFAVGGGWLDPEGPHGVVLRYDGSAWKQAYVY